MAVIDQLIWPVVKTWPEGLKVSSETQLPVSKIVKGLDGLQAQKSQQAGQDSFVQQQPEETAPLMSSSPVVG